MKSLVTDSQVIVYWDHLHRPQPLTYHSWARPGVTGCGRRWFFVRDYLAGRGYLTSNGEFKAAPLNIRHAEKIGVPCMRCYGGGS